MTKGSLDQAPSAGPGVSYYLARSRTGGEQLAIWVSILILVSVTPSGLPSEREAKTRRPEWGPSLGAPTTSNTATAAVPLRQAKLLVSMLDAGSSLWLVEPPLQDFPGRPPEVLRILQSRLRRCRELEQAAKVDLTEPMFARLGSASNALRQADSVKGTTTGSSK